MTTARANAVPAEVEELQRRFRTPLALLLDRFDSYAVVIDSSIVVEDIRWKVLKRTNPAARSLLDRALDSNLLIPFVPDALEDQVEENLHELSERHGVSLDLFYAEWEKIRPRLMIVSVADEDLASVQIRDVTDAAFVAAQRQTNSLAIVSNDKDILESSAPSAGREALEQTNVLQGALLATFGATLGFGLITLAPVFLVGGAVWLIFKLSRHNPLAALLGLAAIALLVWAFWDRIKAMFRKVFSPETKETLLGMLGIWATMAADLQKKSKDAQAALESTLRLPPTAPKAV